MKDVDSLLARILEIAIEVTGAERGFLLLREGEPARLAVKASRCVNGADAESDEHSISHVIMEETLRRKSAVIVGDPGAAPAAELRSILCVPLHARDAVLGLLYLDNRLVRGLFGASEIDLVGAFAGQAGLAIENARTVAELERACRRLRETQAQL